METLKDRPPTNVTDPMRTRPHRIRRVRRETSDTFTLELEDIQGVPAAFLPGQFNMLYSFGIGEAAISISGDPAKPDRLRHTTRRVGVVTGAMAALRKGDVLGVRGPFGTAWPVDDARRFDVALVAGGIGLAPLRPALYHIMAHRKEYGKVVLLYGARTPKDILYRRELESWRSRLDLEVHVTVDQAAAGWHGNVGVVTGLVRRAPFDPLNTVAMVCGPEIMMKFAILELTKRGVPDSAIHLSMERNMKCAVGFCGHCQYGPSFICKDGPVFVYPRIKSLLDVREL